MAEEWEVAEKYSGAIRTKLEAATIASEKSGRFGAFRK